MKMSNIQKYISLEIALIFIAIVLGVLWAIDPTGNYEPFLAIIGLVLTILEMLRRKSVTAARADKIKSSAPSENLVLPSGETKKTTSNITVKEIVETIRSSPPFQKKEIAKQYVGINVEWVGYLKEADVDFRDKSKVRINLNVDREDVIGYSIWFSESITNFPEVRTLKKKAAIRVAGKIIDASSEGLCVELDPVKVEVIENYVA